MLKAGDQVEVTLKGTIFKVTDEFYVVTTHSEPMAHHLSHISRLELERQAMGTIKNISPIQAGDCVITSGGYTGKVVAIDNTTAFVKLPIQTGAPGRSGLPIVSYVVHPLDTLRRK